MAHETPTIPPTYPQLLASIKTQVAQARLRAAHAVNRELLWVYWNIGRIILTEQAQQGWGAKVIERLAADLTLEIGPGHGFSARNLMYMRAFAKAWPTFSSIKKFLMDNPDEFEIQIPIVQQPAAQLGEDDLSHSRNSQVIHYQEDVIVQQAAAQLDELNSPLNRDTQVIHNQDDIIVQQAAAQLDESNVSILDLILVAKTPWSHHQLLLDKLEDAEERLFYCQLIQENNWSRKVLLNQIDTNLHTRTGAITHNFDKTLKPSQAEIAQKIIKDPYFFPFLELGPEAKEYEIETELTKRITSFLLELGKGFAFLGRQVNLKVEEQDFYLDLLFYHLDLKCYVVIELKIDEFKPDYVGQIQFYLNIVDAQLRKKTDKPTIGIVLCKEYNHLVAKYALQNIKKPITISSYELSTKGKNSPKANQKLSSQLEQRFLSTEDLQRLSVLMNQK